LRLHNAKSEWHFECLIFVFQSMSLHALMPVLWVVMSTREATSRQQS
jgi:hypothetical protein